MPQVGRPVLRSRGQPSHSGNLLNVLMPVAMDRTGQGARGFGFFESALSLGMILGIITVSFAGRRLAPRYQIGLAQFLMAAGFAVMALGRFGYFLGGGAVLGFGLGFSEVAAVTLLQLAVPDGMRGKVLGLIFSANAAGLTVGAWLGGVLAARAGVTPVLAAAALAIAGIAAVWTILKAVRPEAVDRAIEAAA